MLDASRFLACSSATLMHINDQLEQAYDQGDLEELDYDEGAGILTIITATDSTFIISRHGPSGQLWLASPLSGGLHFDYHDAEQCWVLPDGGRLNDILARDLQKCCGLHVVL